MYVVPRRAFRGRLTTVLLPYYKGNMVVNSRCLSVWPFSIFIFGNTIDSGIDLSITFEFVNTTISRRSYQQLVDNQKPFLISFRRIVFPVVPFHFSFFTIHVFSNNYMSPQTTVWCPHDTTYEQSSFTPVHLMVEDVLFWWLDSVRFSIPVFSIVIRRVLTHQYCHHFVFLPSHWDHFTTFDKIDILSSWCSHIWEKCFHQGQYGKQGTKNGHQP